MRLLEGPASALSGGQVVISERERKYTHICQCPCHEGHVLTDEPPFSQLGEGSPHITGLENRWRVRCKIRAPAWRGLWGRWEQFNRGTQTSPLLSSGYSGGGQ